MAGNSFGKIFQLTTFGESHGTAIGGILQGCPAGLEVDLDFIRGEMQKRKPGQSSLTTQRSESDEVEFLSGIFEGRTLGTAIGFIIKNQDQQSKDYSGLKGIYRPSHADFTYQQKYGLRDHRGGGRSSARETACRVVAGAIAQLFLKTYQIEIHAYVSQVGKVELSEGIAELDMNYIFENDVRCPHRETAELMKKHIEEVRDEGDSIGGIVSARIINCPTGLGEPVFDKLHADLGKAMLSINAVKAFEYGSGFKAAGMKASEHNDAFVKKGDKITTKSNYSGGIQGGISNGNQIDFRLAFKPVASISKSQKSLDEEGNVKFLEIKGRHDPCVVPRAVPIVSAMAALVIADHLLLSKLNKL